MARSPSRHPLSRALAGALAAAGHRAAPLSDLREVPGFGVSARWQGLAVALRRPDQPDTRQTSLLTIEQREAWLIGFADRLRPDAGDALAMLRALGIEASILSGDGSGAVAAIARLTGLAAEAEASPVAKQQAIARLQAEGHRVLMAGDGLNDAPALAAADASIAPGTASDAGRQAADFVFVTDSLLALPRAVVTARRSMRIVRQNFTLAATYNLVAVPLAILGLVTPLIAAVAMSASSLLVVANSLRLGLPPRLPRGAPR